MTVGELIKELHKWPLDLRVVFETSAGSRVEPRLSGSREEKFIVVETDDVDDC